MRILFMGTPDFSVFSLRALAEAGHEIAGVVTQPDRPKGRGKQIAFSPVKEAALQLGLPVFQPDKIRAEEAMAPLLALAPDILVTAAYGQLIPDRLLLAPTLGSVNVHASLLPRWRGGAPIQRAIMCGDAESGVTIMRMVKKLDAGNILAVVKTPIEDADTLGTLHDRLARLGARLLCDTLAKMEAGEIAETVQDESRVTYAPNLTKEDEEINWNRSAREIFNQVRGLNPRPGAFTTVNGDLLKIWQCKLPDAKLPDPDCQAGRIWINLDQVYVRTKDGYLQLVEVQPAGKKRMPAIDFIRGLRMTDETDLVLGTPAGGLG